MAAFRVGQRVKKVRGCDSGNTGVIVSFIRYNYVDVRWDHAGPCAEGVESKPGEIASAYTHNLEPIQPEGMKPVSWADCLWQPEHMRATS